MLHPLISLLRHPSRVSFYERGGLRGCATFQLNGLGEPGAAGRRVTFSSTDEASNYLRYWGGQPSARAELKWAVQRSGHSSASAHAGAEGWLRVLAACLAAGTVVVIEEQRNANAPGRLVAPPAANSAAAAIEALPTLNSYAPEQLVEAASQAGATESADQDPLPEPEWSASEAVQVAQAETLEQAAVEEKPFCAICEAMGRAEQEDPAEQQPPAAENAEWPASAAAQIAQAETLEEAAQNEQPFCEICEAMRRADDEGKEDE